MSGSFSCFDTELCKGPRKQTRRHCENETKQACPNLTGPACWHQPSELEIRMPHERTRRPAHPSSPSFHTSPGRGAKGAFPTGPMGDRAHAMADRSSQDRRARTGEDAQLVACARATLQVGRGGCNAPSIYCDTNLGTIVDRSTPNSYMTDKEPWLYTSSPLTPLHPRCSPPPPLEKRVRLWGVHWHRTDWRLLGCTPRIHLQTV